MAKSSVLDHVDAHLKEVINRLHFLMIQAYEYQGTNTAQGMEEEIKSLLTTLSSLSVLSKDVTVGLPAEVIRDHVEKSRNPDIYTREYVEHVQKLNQDVKGSSLSYADFARTLADEIKGSFPDLGGDVERVMNAVGDGLPTRS